MFVAILVVSVHFSLIPFFKLVGAGLNVHSF